LYWIWYWIWYWICTYRFDTSDALLNVATIDCAGNHGKYAGTTYVVENHVNDAPDEGICDVC